MNIAELCDRIHCWLWLYDRIPFPKSPDPQITQLNNRINRIWINEMLIDVAMLPLPDDLRGTLAEISLTSAIELAIQSDNSKIEEIRNLLEKVSQYIAIHKLVPNRSWYN